SGGTPQTHVATSTTIAVPLPGPHRHNWLNADGQGVDARRHVAFRSGSPKSLRAPRAVVTRFLAHARFQTAPTSLLTLQTCGGGLRLGRVKIMNSRSGTAACIGRAGLLSPTSTGYTGNVADMSPTCRQDMTFRRDWRRQGGCRRHSGGCRVSAVVGKPRTYVIDTVDAGQGQSRPMPPCRVLQLLSSVSSVLPKAWRRKRALRSLLGAMDGGSDGDDEPRPIKRRSGTGTRPRRREENDSRGRRDGRRGLGRHRRREACPPIPLRVDERRCRRGRLVAHNSRRGWWGELRRWRGDVESGGRRIAGADFSSIRDDDGTASSTPERASGHSASSTRSRVAPRNEKERVPASRTRQAIEKSAQSLDDKDLFGSFTLDGLDKEQSEVYEEDSGDDNR
ncbi:hypothetical protein THAOC_19652, partial [Thalassiosira oceanica]